MQIQNEVLVARIGEQACLHGDDRAVGLGEVFADRGTKHLLVSRMAAAIHGIGINDLIQIQRNALGE